MANKQMRKQASGWSGTFALIGVILAGFIGLLFFIAPKNPNRAIEPTIGESVPAWVISMRKTGQPLLRSAPPANWEFDHEPSLQDGELPKALAFAKRRTTEIDATLRRYQNLAEVRDLKEKFGGKFAIAFFSPKSGGVPIRWTKDIPQINPGDLEIAYFGRDDENHPSVRQSGMAYRGDWDSVVCWAIDYKDPIWFDAFVLHELLHAKLARGGAPSAKSPLLSDLWLDEEDQAHELEEKVLNAGTDGRYFASIKRIVDARNASDIEDLFGKITEDDLRSLEGLFQTASSQEINLRLAEYYFSLYSGWIRQRLPAEQVRAAQAQAYRLMYQYLQ